MIDLVRCDSLSSRRECVDTRAMTGIHLSDPVCADDTLLSVSLPGVSYFKDSLAPARGELLVEPDLATSEVSDAALDVESSTRWRTPKTCQLS